MTLPKPVTSSDAYEPRSASEEIEQVASEAEVAAGGALRGVGLVAVVLLGLLVCPPLAILVVVVVAPLIVIAIGLGLIVGVLSAPYLLVHHFRAHDGRHLSLLSHRLHRAGRALVDLAPYRIVADARKVDAGR
jgi:hypothetical protein